MTPPTVQGPTRSSASGPVRGTWALFSAFLLFWLVLEMVNHGGGTIPLGIAGLFTPDLTLFVGPSGSHEAGQLPPRPCEDRPLKPGNSGPGTGVGGHSGE